jgi:hypothetical protein
MIRHVIFSILLLLTSKAMCQHLTDIAADQEITDFQNFQLTNANGMSFYDFDEDGWDDITYPMHNDSIIFYKNNQGQFQKIPSMLKSEGDVRQICWVDYDNDGNLDLCISYDDFGVSLYRNLGSFNFENVSISSGIYPSVNHPFGFSFADPDKDNDLDLYIADYSDPAGDGHNMYFQNQGDGTFIERSMQLDIDNDTQPSFIGVWFDFNNDDKTDLHVINDRAVGVDALYKNTTTGSSELQFIDVGEAVGVSNEGQNPMTSSVSDYNNDGFQDIFVTDFGISSLSGEGPFHYKLFENNNGISFTDKAPTYNMSINDFGWGALWVDYNNDMFEDLYIATGNTINNSGTPTHSILYENNSGTSFTKINDSIVGDVTTVSFCPLKGDINNDGFYDVVVLNQDIAPNILLNSSNANNYIKITPEGTTSNRMAIGAEIRVFVEGIQQLQTVFCGEQLCAQNSQHKIFGAGSAEIIDSIFVKFPSGLIAKRYAIPVNQSIIIQEESFAIVAFQLIENTDSLLLCQGDSIVLSAGSFNAYNWSTGSQDSSITVNTPGVYYFEAFNITGDTLYHSNDLIVEIEAEPLFQIITTPTSCNEPSSGAAELNFADLSIIDSVEWSNGASGFDVNGLSEDSYTYTFYTENLCLYEGAFTIGSIEPMNVQYTSSPYTNEALGSISIYMFGGNPPYTYLLNEDTVASNVNDLSYGTYTLVVYDSIGCSIQTDIEIQNLSTVGLQAEAIETNLQIKENYVEFCSQDEELKDLEIFDLKGLNVLSVDLNNRENSECTKYNFHGPSGIYIGILSSPTKRIRKKLYKP